MIALIIVPLVAALVAVSLPSKRYRRSRPIVVAVAAGIHVVLTFRLRAGDVSSGGWLAVDSLGHLVLGVLSVIFALCSAYAIGYLRVRSERPNRIFTVCMLSFLAMTTVVTLAQHLGLLWVAMEGATLSMAMLIYFNQNARSLEAAWKYLMIGSVGMTLGYTGSLFFWVCSISG